MSPQDEEEGEPQHDDEDDGPQDEAERKTVQASDKGSDKGSYKGGGGSDDWTKGSGNKEHQGEEGRCEEVHQSEGKA